MTEVRYHAALFAFLGERPERSASAVGAVQAWEAQHGLTLPAAVREWYELDGPALWRKYSPRDYVPELGENPPLQLWKIEHGQNECGEIDYLILLTDPLDKELPLIEPVDSRRFLLLSMETDCGMKTIVPLDETDDPETALDGNGSSPDTANCGAFSNLVFDYLHFYASTPIEHNLRPPFPLIVTAKDEHPTDDDLRALRTAFHSGPLGRSTFGWNYRFYTDGNFVLIGKWFHYGNNGPTWQIRSRSPADLCHALASLWPLANLRQTLVLEQKDERLQVILERIRNLAGPPEEVANQWRKAAALFQFDT